MLKSVKVKCGFYDKEIVVYTGTMLSIANKKGEVGYVPLWIYQENIKHFKNPLIFHSNPRLYIDQNPQPIEGKIWACNPDLFVTLPSKDNSWFSPNWVVSGSEQEAIILATQAKI